MKHRNINTTEWTRMAIDSLFEDGILSDWKEFFIALRKDEMLARETLSVCKYHTNVESAALAKVLVRHFYGSDEDMGLN
jgi:hypothetical protein